MAEEVVDYLGEPVKPGDRIVTSFRVGNIAEIRVGTIIDYGENDYRPTLRVKWFSINGKTYKNSFIYSDLKRFVKIKE